MDRTITARHVFRYIVNTIKPFGWAVLTMLIVQLYWSIDLSLKPYMLKIILNNIHANTALENLLLPVSLYLGSSFILFSLFSLSNYIIDMSMLPKLRARITDSALMALVKRDYIFFQQHSPGSISNKISDLITGIPEIVRICVEKFLGHLIALIISITSLWQVNIIFGIAMLVWSSIFIIIAFIFSGSMNKLADSCAECISDVAGQILDTLINITAVKLFYGYNSERRNLQNSLNISCKTERQFYWQYAIMWTIYHCSFFILQIINFWFLLKGVKEQWITTGDFVLVITLNTSIMSFLCKTSKDFSQLSKVYGQIIQALKIILYTDQTEKNDPLLECTNGHIFFDKVNFTYNGTDPLFTNKSVDIDGGQKIGIVGYSGSGKSTFISLILRLYEVNEGKIFIDGQDISCVDINSLRENIGVILQEPTLFNRDIMSNIRYGKENASDSEVIEAAKKAHAHEFITNLPQGYHAIIGERGIKLSGGQKQRISIARAILKDAPILILDEATSQLDTITENDIQKSLRILMENKTTIVIAHRLSTLLRMDRILVIDKGKIIQDGTHIELLRQEGLYKTLWEAQVDGFLQDLS